MLAPITTLTPNGLPGPAPAEGLVPPIGPIVILAFTLPIAGPVPNVIQPPVPQSCQNACPNVALQALVIDQAGAPVDLSAASSVSFWLLGPDGTPRPVVAALVNNGADGLIQYLTSNQDLPEAGTWALQAQLVFGSTVIVTRWAYFNVEPNVADF